jgi:membrane protease YdiL (CAAX protease family)
LILSLPICAAGAAGYFLSLLPCQKLARRLVTATFFLGFASLLAIPIVAFFWFRDDTEPANFGSQSLNSPHLWNPGVILRLTSNLGPGFQFAAGGFVLIAMFAALFIWNRVTLPVRLIDSPALPTADLSEWDHRRTMMFVWMMISLVPLALLMGGAIILGTFSVFSKAVISNAAWINWIEGIGSALPLLVLVLLALGRARKETLRQSFHLPPIRYLGLAISFPAAIASVWPVISYLHDRIQWATYDLGRFGVPHLGSYFAFPRALSLWYLVPALVEEIAWRGYLQPRLIRRYGLMRGIFLLGIAWGAFHFSGDFHFYMTPGGVVLKIATRLAETIVYSYVLAWLTIQSHSILPAAIAHGVLNIFVFYPLYVNTPWWPHVALWAILGYVLFHYFSPQLIDAGATSDSHPA